MAVAPRKRGQIKTGWAVQSTQRCGRGARACYIARGIRLRYVPFPLETVPTNIAARDEVTVVRWIRARMSPAGDEPAGQSRAANWTELDGRPQEMADDSCELVAKNWLVAAKRS